MNGTGTREAEVQEAIQREIDRWNESFRRKELEPYMRVFTPDYEVHTLGGEVLGLEQIRGSTERHFEVLIAVSDETRITVEGVSLADREAVAFTRQRFVRTQLGPDDQPHRVVSSVTHLETWVDTPEGWKLRRIRELEQGPTFVDGEPYFS